MKETGKSAKRFGFIAAALCVGCCSFPFIGTILGISSLSVLSRYVEWAGLAAFGMAIILFALYYYKKRKAPSCDINCETKAVAAKKQDQ